jgi:hypothetical protein
MSDFNIIPNEVQPMGPMWQRLPMDITMEIMAYTIMVMPVYNKPGRIMNKKWFDILTGLGVFKKFRLWCLPQPMVMMKPFYQGHTFVFDNGNDLGWAADESVAPFLPPHAFRHLLRRIQVSITLHDFLYIVQPGSDRCMLHPFGSVDELMQHCPGARSLRNLTNTTTGFSNLDVLDLEIIPDFRSGNHMATLAIMTAAAFAVSARNVTITVQQAPLGYLSTFKTHIWVPEFKSVIAVTLVE